MRKLIALLLALTVGVAVAGCNTQEQPQTTQTATTQTATTQATEAAGFLPEITDEALVKAVDLYVRITLENDTLALDELPEMMWSICRNSKAEYAKYMQEHPLDKPFTGQWQIVSVGNPFGDNSFDVALSIDGQSQTVTLTKQDGVYIMDELVFYFDGITSVLNG